MPNRPAPPASTQISVSAVLALPQAERDRYLDRIVPEPLRILHDLPATGSWREGAGNLRLEADVRHGKARIEVWPEATGEDPALAVELADTHLGKLELVWVVLNDLREPRYGVDRDVKGDPIPLGTHLRNSDEEQRALAAGLAPNQVRAGLHLFRSLLRNVEEFARLLGVDLLYVSPLAYHNAIQYERYGFTYASEQEEMEEIHREFLPGGALHRLMDGSRPFRMPWMAATVRGRSWAVHDGILERSWQAPQMYKFIGRDFHTCTFPDASW